MKISQNLSEEISNLWNGRILKINKIISFFCLGYSSHFILLLFFFLTFCSCLTAQEIKLSGTIKDSTGLALPNANIIAFAENSKDKTRFAISDEKGRYVLDLGKSMEYNIHVSYLGYKKQSKQIRLFENTKMDFTLTPEVKQLEEVELNYRIPVVVKPDTIIYNVEAFATGDERKLRELLKKLPGIEVDFEGNVKAQGEKITKVLVDGEIFLLVIAKWQ